MIEKNGVITNSKPSSVCIYYTYCGNNKIEKLMRLADFGLKDSGGQHELREYFKRHTGRAGIYARLHTRSNEDSKAVFAGNRRRSLRSITW